MHVTAAFRSTADFENRLSRALCRRGLPFVVDVVIAAEIADGQFDLAADERAGGGAVSGNG